MTDNAYVFAREATPAAVAALKAEVGGVLRVVCPLTGGDRALYVAAAEPHLVTGVGTVGATPGVAGVDSHVVLPPPVGPGGSNPTYCEVKAWVGFGVFGGSFDPAAQPLVVGFATVRTDGSSGDRFIVEVTADDEGAVRAALTQIGSAPGVTPVLTAWGRSADGAGFSHSS